jgi:hypothetical protein
MKADLKIAILIIKSTLPKWPRKLKQNSIVALRHTQEGRREGGREGEEGGGTSCTPQKASKNWIIKMQWNMKIEDTLSDFLTTPSTSLKRIWKWLCILWLLQPPLVCKQIHCLCSIAVGRLRNSEFLSLPTCQEQHGLLDHWPHGRPSRILCVRFFWCTPLGYLYIFLFSMNMKYKLCLHPSSIWWD